MKKSARKNPILLGISSLLNDLSSEMIMPILPLFIASLGGAGIIIGIISGIRESISSILKVIFGYISDKTGKRKIFVVYGYLTSSLFKLFLGISKTLSSVLVFSGLERIGKGLRTAPRDSLLAESLPQKRGKSFGIHRAMDTSGAILGSIAVLILFWSLNLTFNSIILIASLLSFLALLPLVFVKEKKTKPSKLKLKPSLKLIPKKAKKFIAIASIFALSNISYMFFILKAKQSLETSTAIALTLILYIFFNIFYASLAVPFGNLSDRIGKKKIILAGYLLFSLLSVGFIFLKSFPLFLFLFAVYGVSYAMINSNQRAYIADLSNPKNKSTTIGAFHTAVGITALPANLLAGILWQISPAATFIYSASISFITFIIFFMSKE